MKKTLLALALLSFCLCNHSVAQWATDGNGNIFNTNNSNVGYVGIGTGNTATPQAQLEVRSALLGSTAGSMVEMTRLTGVSGNGSYLKFTLNRFAAGSDWTTANTRIQAWTDVTPQGFVDFNPNGSLNALALGANNTESMRILQNSYIGLFTTNPQTSFEVHALGILGTTAGSTSEITRFYSNTGNGSQLRILTSRFANGNSWTTANTRILAVTDGTNQGYIDFNPNGGSNPSGGWSAVAFGSGTVEAMRLLPAGNVLIGKISQTNSAYLLDVNGPARANQVVVNTTGADFVFDPGYRLPSLQAVEEYVRTNRHLPDIASAGQMQEQGLDLGENQTRLLQKIEELTLYVIEQNKEIQALKDKNQALTAMEQRLSRLEQLAAQPK